MNELPKARELAPVTVSGGASNLGWYIRLRWLAVLLQTVVVVVGVFGTIPIGSINMYVAVAAITLVTNVGAREFARATSMTDSVTFILLSLDVVLLTLILWYAGGPANPLILLYVVHVALGAVMVPPELSWPAGALVVFCYGALFVLPAPDSGAYPVAQELLDSEFFREHLLNQWWAFTGVAVLLAYFITRVTRSLILRERELALVARRAARDEKMASLATLATGAAHELGTPLGTIGLVATELERAIERGAKETELVEDARLIRSQVERCRAIIDSMRSEAGEGYERLEPLALDALIREARDNLPPGYSERIRVLGAFPGRVLGPRKGLCQALRNLLKNGLDASPPHAPVMVEVEQRGDAVAVEIRDLGSGIPSEVLDRVGEPFFTTKEAGRGMGLGLFVTQAVIERAGGSIKIDSEPGVGTAVTVALPVMGE
ncbi:MAG: ATP-binding protein [Myxococcota bacterium]